MTHHKKHSDTLKLGGGFAVGVIVLALIGGVVYFNMHTEGVIGSPVGITTDWNAPALNVTDVLKRAFPETDVGGRGSVSIEEQVDITGDGIPEAFVALGTGGASVEYLSLLRMDNGTPVVSKVKDIDGIVGPLQLLQGAAVLHSSDIGTVPKEDIVYQRELSYSPEDGSISSCAVQAYRWDSAETLFVYDPDASLSLQAQRCMQ